MYYDSFFMISGICLHVLWYHFKPCYFYITKVNIIGVNHFGWYQEKAITLSYYHNKLCAPAGRWYSPETLVSSANKAGRQDIAETLFKVSLSIVTFTLLRCLHNPFIVRWHVCKCMLKSFHNVIGVPYSLVILGTTSKTIMCLSAWWIQEYLSETIIPSIWSCKVDDTAIWLSDGIYKLIVIISSKYKAGIRIHYKYEEAVLINHSMERRK